MGWTRTLTARGPSVFGEIRLACASAGAAAIARDHAPQAGRERPGDEPTPALEDLDALPRVAYGEDPANMFYTYSALSLGVMGQPRQSLEFTHAAIGNLSRFSHTHSRASFLS